MAGVPSNCWRTLSPVTLTSSLPTACLAQIHDMFYMNRNVEPAGGARDRSSQPGRGGAGKSASVATRLRRSASRARTPRRANHSRLGRGGPSRFSSPARLFPTTRKSKRLPGASPVARTVGTRRCAAWNERPRLNRAMRDCAQSSLIPIAGCGVMKNSTDILPPRSRSRLPTSSANYLCSALWATSKLPLTWLRCEPPLPVKQPNRQLDKHDTASAEMTIAVWSHDAAAISRVLATKQSEVSFNGIFYPDAWFEALAARMRGDTSAAPAAFRVARAKWRSG